MQNPNRVFFLISAVAFAFCAILVVGLLFYAPLALAVAVWIAWPVTFAVLVAQLVTTPQPAKPDSKPSVIVHEDGSIEAPR